jgi:hypothetical protein
MKSKLEIQEVTVGFVFFVVEVDRKIFILLLGKKAKW